MAVAAPAPANKPDSCLLRWFKRNRDLLTASLMGYTSGYATSNTKVRFNTFGGMMTGNTVKLGIAMQQETWDWAGVYFCCILLFFLGTIASLFMIQKLGESAQHAFLLVFCGMFVLVDGLALAVDTTPEEYNIYASLVSTLACFALGAQNLLSQKSGVVKANTTFMTGNIQKMAEALWNAWDKRKAGGLKPAEQRAAWLLFCTWFMYVVGGVCGAAMASLTQFHWSLTPVALLYAAGMWSMQVEPPKPAPEPPTPKPAAAPAPDAVPAKIPNVMVDLTPSTASTTPRAGHTVEPVAQAAPPA